MADLTPKECGLKVVGSAGVAALAISASLENLVTYISGPGWLWLVVGTIIASFWAYETYCREDNE